MLRAVEPGIDPPVCTTPMFGDVEATSFYCPWIEEFARRGITSGCGSGNYCPLGTVTRGQMAAFIPRTFSMTLYGP
jgi:hypothetical protein